MSTKNFSSPLPPPMSELIAALPSRLANLFVPPPVDDSKKQLSIGLLDGDIPIFPPIFILVVTLLGFAMTALLPSLPALPPLLIGKRHATAVCLVAGFFLIVNLAGQDLAAAKTTVDFGVVNELSTTGLYGYSRNPIYTAGIALLIPATMFVSDSLYVLLCHVLLTIPYLRYVVSVEENFLTNFEGYGAYKENTARFLPKTLMLFVFAFFIAHELEFLMKIPLFRKREDKGRLSYHFIMTLLWGVVYWSPIANYDKKKNC